jgi:hypothetical protein
MIEGGGREGPEMWRASANGRLSTLTPFETLNLTDDKKLNMIHKRIVN